MGLRDIKPTKDYATRFTISPVVTTHLPSQCSGSTLDLMTTAQVQISFETPPTIS